MKLGKEVEGEYLGVFTLFCSFEEIEALPEAMEKYAHGVDQLYISDHGNQIDLQNPTAILPYKSQVGLITVERTRCESPHHPGIDVMLVIDSPSFWALGEEDQVKFSRDLHVRAMVKRNMVVTIPSDFKGDKEIFVRPKYPTAEES